jgi:hypothetical protein
VHARARARRCHIFSNNYVRNTCTLECVNLRGIEGIERDIYLTARYRCIREPKHPGKCTCFVIFLVFISRLRVKSRVFKEAILSQIFTLNHAAVRGLSGPQSGPEFQPEIYGPSCRPCAVKIQSSRPKAYPRSFLFSFFLPPPFFLFRRK